MNEKLSIVICDYQLSIMIRRRDPQLPILCEDFGIGLIGVGWIKIAGSSKLSQSVKVFCGREVLRRFSLRRSEMFIGRDTIKYPAGGGVGSAVL